MVKSRRQGTGLWIIQGPTTNRDETNPITVVCKTAKHNNSLYAYLKHTLPQFGDVVVHLSVDGSPFLAIMRKY